MLCIITQGKTNGNRKNEKKADITKILQMVHPIKGIGGLGTMPKTDSHRKTEQKDMHMRRKTPAETTWFSAGVPWKSSC